MPDDLPLQPYSWTRTGWVGSYRRWYGKLPNWGHGMVWCGPLVVLIAVIAVAVALPSSSSSLNWHQAAGDIQTKSRNMDQAFVRGNTSDGQGWRNEVVAVCQNVTLLVSDGSADEQKVRAACASVGNPLH